jgi:hypothetical protein
MADWSAQRDRMDDWSFSAHGLVAASDPPPN